MRTHQNDLTNYLNSLVPQDSLLSVKSKTESEVLNKKSISLEPFEAHIIKFFIELFQCSKFIELGTLTGYSGLKIIESLKPKGHLWTFELDSQRAEVAKNIFQEAGVSDKVSILVGKAEDNLLKIEHEGPFDGIFIDANKASYPWYLEWSLKNLKTGGLIIADNTLLKGVVPTPNEEKPNKIIRQLRLFNELLKEKNQFHSILIPTSEGLSVAIKK